MLRGQSAGAKGDYQVGYGKPPRNAGFKKGQSGTRAGGRRVRRT